MTWPPGYSHTSFQFFSVFPEYPGDVYKRQELKEEPMDKIEQKILNTIDAHREEIIKIGRDIWEHAECCLLYTSRCV